MLSQSDLSEVTELCWCRGPQSFQIIFISLSKPEYSFVLIFSIGEAKTFWNTRTVLKTMSLWLSILANKSLCSDTLLYQIHSKMPIWSNPLFASKQKHCCFISIEPEKMCRHLGHIIDGHDDSNEANGQGTWPKQQWQGLDTQLELMLGPNPML